MNEYRNNIRKIEAGLPYRKRNPEGFRAVHRELANAKANGSPVEGKVLEFCFRGDGLLLRERYWITKLAPSLNGPKKGKTREPITIAKQAAAPQRLSDEDRDER